jgi:ribosomal protein S18 acetylase RimI-like enzyme
MVRAAGPGDLSDIRAMLEEYAAGLGVDLSYQDFARELRDLPGDYVPPAGALLVGHVDAAAVGMVAMRPRSPDRSEMKRLYVRPAARGTGLGRQLADAIIDAARLAGYREICLDTLPTMQNAQRLYEHLGFRDVSPYYDSPVAGTRFMMLDL